MSDPDEREGADSTGVEESPVPAKGERFGFDLGNPVERESAAFSWLIVVIIAGVSVGAVAKLISLSPSTVQARREPSRWRISCICRASRTWPSSKPRCSGAGWWDRDARALNL